MDSNSKPKTSPKAKEAKTEERKIASIEKDLKSAIGDLSLESEAALKSKLLTALVKAKKDFGNISKDTQGYGYTYVSLPNILKAIHHFLTMVS